MSQNTLFYLGIIPYKTHTAWFLYILVKYCEMTVIMSEQQPNSKKGFGGERQCDIFYFFSSAFGKKKKKKEDPRLHVQLSDGICLWFSLTFFSHWVIQNYNIHATLVFQIPKGIISPLCSHATPKESYEEGLEILKILCKRSAPGTEGVLFS